MNVKRQVCLIWFVIIKLLNTVVLKMYRLKQIVIQIYNYVLLNNCYFQRMFAELMLKYM